MDVKVAVRNHGYCDDSDGVDEHYEYYAGMQNEIAVSSSHVGYWATTRLKEGCKGTKSQTVRHKKAK